MVIVEEDDHSEKPDHKCKIRDKLAHFDLHDLKNKLMHQKNGDPRKERDTASAHNASKSNGSSFGRDTQSIGRSVSDAVGNVSDTVGSLAR